METPADLQANAVYRHHRDPHVYARIAELPEDGAVLYSVWDRSVPGWQDGAGLGSHHAFRETYPIAVSTDGTVPTALTNDTARHDFIAAYARSYGAPSSYAEQLLDELLDERSQQNAETILEEMKHHSSHDYAAGLYSAAIIINPFATNTPADPFKE